MLAAYSIFMSHREESNENAICTSFI